MSFCLLIEHLDVAPGRNAVIGEILGFDLTPYNLGMLCLPDLRI